MTLPRMIVTDLDGTLLPESKVLPESTRQVLMSLREKGVIIALATGKFYHLTLHYAEQLGAGIPVVALDGARVHDESNGAVTQGIPRALIEELLTRFDQAHLSVFADSGDDEMLLRAEPGDIPMAIRAWASRIRRVEDVRSNLVGDPALLSFYGPDKAEAEQIAQTVLEEHPGIRGGTFPTLAYGEARVVFQPQGISKGTGVRQLCDQMGVAPGDCMVFGDWHNDRPMFDQGFINVAMANAVPELLEKADHVTPLDNEHEGVADFLRRCFPEVLGHNSGNGGQNGAGKS